WGRRQAADNVDRVSAGEHMMQEVVIPHRQLGERMLCSAAKMLGEARPLQMGEEPGVVRATEDSTIQQQTKERPPPDGVPVALEERPLCLDRVAGEHAFDARARLNEETKRENDQTDEALGDAGAEHAGRDRREML